MSEKEKPSEALIAKIRKILSKTEKEGCTQAEAEAAFAMATRLMAEHNLEMADVTVKDEENAIDWGDMEVLDTARWNYEYQLAYGIVKEFCFVEGFFTWRYGTGKARKVLQFFGTKPNIAAATFMFSALLAAADRLWTTYRCLSGRPAYERRMYVAGVAMGFRDKLRADRKAMEVERDIMQGKANGSTALALVTIQDQTVAKYREMHPEIKKPKGRGATYASLSGDAATLNAGYSAGRALNLNRAVGGHGQKRIGT